MWVKCVHTRVHIWFYIYNDKRRTSGQERGGGHLGRAEHFEDVVGEKSGHCGTVLVNALKDLHQHLMRGGWLIDWNKQKLYWPVRKPHLGSYVCRTVKLTLTLLIQRTGLLCMVRVLRSWIVSLKGPRLSLEAKYLKRRPKPPKNQIMNKKEKFCLSLYFSDVNSGSQIA